MYYCLMKKAILLIVFFGSFYSCKKCTLCEGYFNGRWYGQEVCTTEKTITKTPILMITDDNGNTRAVELTCN